MENCKLGTPYPVYNPGLNAKTTMRLCRSYSGVPRLIHEDKLLLRPSAYAIVRNEADLLVVRDEQSGKYYLPGGGLEPGETLAEAVIRETKEETGIEVEVGECVHFQEDFFYYDPLDEAYHGFLSYYNCKTRDPSLKIRPDGEFLPSTPCWVPLATLQPEHFKNHGETVLGVVESDNRAS